MIEVVHILNRHGKRMSFVLEVDKNLGAHTPSGKHYAQQYALGNERPFYPLPTIIKEAVITSDDVYIASVKQADRPEGQDWIECDNEGWVWCLTYWRKPYD